MSLTLLNRLLNCSKLSKSSKLEIIGKVSINFVLASRPPGDFIHFSTILNLLVIQESRWIVKCLQ